MNGLLASAGPFAYLGLFGIAAGESSALLGLALPGEAFVLVAGALAARGSLSLFWLLPCVIGGAILGDSIGYALGRHFGGCRDHGWLGKVWSCDRMTRVRVFFDRRGGAAVFLGRFIGFLRPLVPFAAGAVRMPYRPFLAYNVAGAVVWGTGTLLAGYLLGAPVEHLLRSAGAWLAFAIGAVGLFAILHRRRSKRMDETRRAAADEQPARRDWPRRWTAANADSLRAGNPGGRTSDLPGSVELEEKGFVAQPRRAAS